MEFRAQVWVAVVFAVLITGATIAAAVFSKKNPGQDVFVATEISGLTNADWTRGNKAAAVTLTEFGDFQCPACAQYAPIVQQLEKEYGDRVLFGFRNFPLYQNHQYAGIAAQAAGAAGLQGKFWEMHDTLYTKQSAWATAKDAAAAKALFAQYGKEIGLDPARFTADFDAPVVTDKIDTDAAEGRAAQVDHTPTFFLNRKQIPNPQNYEQFKSILDAALASSTTAR